MMEQKSRGMLMKNDGNGPIMRGLFELTREDLKKLVDKAKAGEKIEFRLSMWPERKSKRGNPYWGLTIDEDRKPQEASDPFASTRAKSEDPFGRTGNDTFWGGVDPDDEIPFG